MKYLSTKSITGKLIIAILVVVLLFNFVFAQNVSNANAGHEVVNTFLNLFMYLGDGCVWLLQKLIYGTGETFIHLGFKESGWAIFGAILAGIAVIAAAVVFTVLTCGLGGIALAAAIAGAVIGAAGTAIIVGGVVYLAVDGLLPEDVDLPIFYTTPEEIFGNKIGLLDVNFFNPKNQDAKKIEDESQVADPRMPDVQKQGLVGQWYLDNGGSTGIYDGVEAGDELITRSPANMLRDQIAAWYGVLRTIALVGLLTVLVYVGIRILLASVASEKAKYKNMVGYWATAMALLFVLHYIMVFSVTIVEKFADGISGTINPVVVLVPGAEDRDIVDKLKNSETDGVPSLNFYGLDPDEIIDESVGDKGVVYWPTNHMGQARLNAQLVGHNDTQTLYRKAAYTISYCVLVFFTVFYLVQYIKRVVYLAFLTLIAPLITLTYPLDKIGDGKAQAFDYWLKEYLCNLLIQPFHLILYLILIGSAMEFATTNVIYTCVVLGFMMPAEKLLRKMFRIDSDTNKKGSGAAAGALAMAGLNQLGKLGRGNKGGNSGGSGKDGKDGRGNGERTLPPRTKGNDGFNDMHDGGVDGNNGPEDPAMDTDVGQDMLDAYDDNFGTSDWDPQERDAMARDLEQDNEPDRASDLDNSIHGYEQMLEGMDDDDPQKAEFEKDLEEMRLERESLNQPAEEQPDEAQEKQNEEKQVQETQKDQEAVEGVNKAQAELQKARERAQARAQARRSRGQVGVGRGIGRAITLGAARTINSGSRLVAKGALGATVAGVGAITSIGSGHFESLPKNIAAGAATGIAIGSAAEGLSGKIGGFAGNTIRNVGEDYRQGQRNAVQQLGVDERREYQVNQLENSASFKEHMEEKQIENPTMSTEDLQVHSDRMMEYAEDTGVGLTGNRDELKTLEKALNAETELIEKEGMDAETAARRTKNAVAESAGYSRKDFRKDRKVIRESLVKALEEEFMSNGMSKADAEKLAGERIDEKLDLMEKLYK